MLEGKEDFFSFYCCTFAEAELLSEPQGILEAVITAFSLEDIESTAAYFAYNADFVIVTTPEIVLNGRPDITRRLQKIVTDFHVDRFEVRTILPTDDGLRTQILFAFRHRATGQVIDGVMRVTARVQNGRIVRWREYQDADRVEAFMRLVQSSRET